MSSYDTETWAAIQAYLAELESAGKVKATFRRLDFAKQQVILTSILEALADRPRAVNIKRVAADAGVSVGSMYQYFENSAAMIDAAVLITAKYTVSSLSALKPLLCSLPLREALSAYLIGGIEWSETNRAFLRLFAQSAYHGDDIYAETLVIPIADAMWEMILAVLETGVKRGELPLSTDVRSAARIVNGLFAAMADSVLIPHLNRYFHFFGAIDAPHEQIANAVDFVMNGLLGSKK